MGSKLALQLISHVSLSSQQTWPMAEFCLLWNRNNDTHLSPGCCDNGMHGSTGPDRQELPEDATSFPLSFSPRCGEKTILAVRFLSWLCIWDLLRAEVSPAVKREGFLGSIPKALRKRERPYGSCLQSSDVIIQLHPLYVLFYCTWKEQGYLDI